jgi:hypothetical protein
MTGFNSHVPLNKGKLDENSTSEITLPSVVNSS